MHDFSQLPVFSGLRDLRSVVSWRSVGRSLALGRHSSEVRECMEKSVVLEYDTPLFTAIETIYNKDYALNRLPDKRIGGIVTTADLTQEFRVLAEPFLMLQEIEHSVRLLLRGRFELQELMEARDDRDAERSVASPDDLTFGEYIRLLQRPENWSDSASDWTRPYSFRG